MNANLIKRSKVIIFALVLLQSAGSLPVAAVPGLVEGRWACEWIQGTMKCIDTNSPFSKDVYECIDPSYGWACHPYIAGTESGARELEAALDNPANAGDVPPDPSLCGGSYGYSPTDAVAAAPSANDLLGMEASGADSTEPEPVADLCDTGVMMGSLIMKGDATGSSTGTMTA